MAIMNQTKVNPYMRSVSIIGVGCTPFMYTVDREETNGLKEGELFGYAALKAMEDAGVSPRDVDFYFHGEASPLNGSNYLTPNIQIANWFGMKGKALGMNFKTFVSTYAYEHGIKEELGLDRIVLPVHNTRDLMKSDMKFNDYAPSTIAIDPQNFTVTIDGETIDCDPVDEIALTQRYYLY